MNGIDAAMAALMADVRTIAIVGVSAKADRPSYGVARYLRDHAPEYTVWYVNPRESTILGEQVFSSLADVPEPPDLVDIFRRVDDLPGVVDDAIACRAGAVWFQLGLVHDDAAARAAAAGLAVVQDRCLKVEHARLMRRTT